MTDYEYQPQRREVGKEDWESIAGPKRIYSKPGPAKAFINKQKKQDIVNAQYAINWQGKPLVPHFYEYRLARRPIDDWEEAEHYGKFDSADIIRI